MLIYLFANCASIEKKRSITDDHRSFVLEERNDPRLSLLLRQERRPEVWDITVTLLLAKGKSGSSAFGRRWIHKSEGRVSRWKSANRFDLHPFRNDSGPRAWLPLVTNSDFLENAKTFPTSVLTFPRTSFIAFISRYMCTYTHVHTHDNRRAIQLSSLCSFPGSTSTSDDIGGRKESSTDRTCPPWSFYCSLSYCSYSGLVDVESDVDSIYYYYYCRCYFFGEGKRRNILFTIVDRPCFDEI